MTTDLGHRPTPPEADISVRIADARQQIRDGEVPSWIYSDAEVFRLEKERLFQRTWVYLAHESEIPNSGEKYAMDAGTSPSSDWYQRGCVR